MTISHYCELVRETTMLSNTKRTEIKKGAHKAVTEVEKLHTIIDESLIAHIAITNESGPVVIPMLAWRVDDFVYIHGANNSRLLRSLKQGQPTCLTFTLFDGWVLARSAFHHSAHYRSAVVFGQFETVEDNQEKDRLLNHFLEQIAPGRTKHVRLSNEKELSATMLLRISLEEASVKISVLVSTTTLKIWIFRFGRGYCHIEPSWGLLNHVQICMKASKNPITAAPILTAGTLRRNSAKSSCC